MVYLNEFKILGLLLRIGWLIQTRPSGWRWVYQNGIISIISLYNSQITNLNLISFCHSRKWQNHKNVFFTKATKHIFRQNPKTQYSAKITVSAKIAVFVKNKLSRQNTFSRQNHKNALSHQNTFSSLDYQNTFFRQNHTTHFPAETVEHIFRQNVFSRQNRKNSFPAKMCFLAKCVFLPKSQTHFPSKTTKRVFPRDSGYNVLRQTAKTCFLAKTAKLVLPAKQNFFGQNCKNAFSAKTKNEKMSNANFEIIVV